MMRNFQLMTQFYGQYCLTEMKLFMNCLGKPNEKVGCVKNSDVIVSHYYSGPKIIFQKGRINLENVPKYIPGQSYFLRIKMFVMRL